MNRQEVIEHIFHPQLKLAFVHCREHCTVRISPESGTTTYIKDLQKLTRRGYKQVKNDVQGDEVYSYWKSSKGRCVVVHFNASRHVASIAPGLESSCK
jgi:hypothetical protein